MATTHIALTQTTNFEKFYGGEKDDYGSDIIRTSDNGFIIIGTSYSFGTTNFNNPTYVIKTNNKGDIVWTKVFGLSSNNTLSRRIIEKNGFYYISGYGDGGYGIFLIKLNQNGEAVWTKKYFEGNNTSTGGGLVALDDGFLISGQVWGPFSTHGAALIRTNLDGDILWTKVFPYMVFQSSLLKASDGNFISTTSFNDIEDYGLVKFNTSGDTLWTKKYYRDKNTRINSVTTSNDGGFVITGGYYTTSWSDGFIIKTDQNGNEIWSKIFDSKVTNDNINSIVAVPSGYVFANDIIVNSTTTFIRLRKIDESGISIWTKDYDCLNSLVSSIKLNSDKGFSMIGSVRKTPTSNFADIYHIRTDSLGRVIYQSDTIKICKGESVTIGNQPKTSTGGYYDTMKNKFNCDSIVYKYLKVFDLPNTPVIISPLNTVVQCSGIGGIALTSDTPVGTTSYQWYKNGIIASGEILKTILLPDARASTGTYQVLVKGKEPTFCKSALSTILSVTVNELPAVTFNLPSDSVCNNIQPFLLSGGNPVGGTYSFLGTDNNTLDPSTIAIGNLSIKYKFKDANNCSNEATDQLKIKDCTITGIEELRQRKVNIFPNPTYSSITVEIDNDGFDFGDEVVIRNSLGQTVMRASINSNGQYDLPTSGIYYVTVKNKRDILTTKKIIKK